MPDLNDLKPDVFVPQLLNVARTTAGPLWDDIQQTASHEFRVLALRIRDIGEGVASGDVSRTAARILFRMAKRNLIATIAMLTIMIEAAAQKLVNAVLKEIKSIVNGALGFTLV
ncbi:hypothetical protein [Shimia abyssi]|uniref:Uncharacterized protein n=1 Tax=Shimia abyssi TaxID=1662395 RepID=A0A2P8FGU8_9RHOB|nr:hypothetical protein [Shimia abyssi]PSL20952.1 hypothetical protein CLV88_10271 [Shimia abyssi]